MSDTWPPQGYSSPKPYIRSVRLALVIAAIVGTAMGFITLSSIRASTRLLIEQWVDIAQSLGLAVLSIYVSGILLWLIWMTLLIVGMIVIHESIHYCIGRVLKLEPRFKWDEYIVLKNPSIVVYGEGIKRWENIVMLAAPFVLITIVSLITMTNTVGMVSGSAAVILLINSAVSGQDLYHVLRLLTMPNGTQFANYADGEQLRTEYTVPMD